MSHAYHNNCIASATHYDSVFKRSQAAIDAAVAEKKAADTFYTQAGRPGPHAQTVVDSRVKTAAQPTHSQ